MTMVSSLIGGFSKQTKDTILEHLDKLAVNNAVYSTHLKGFEPQDCSPASPISLSLMTSLLTNY